MNDLVKLDDKDIEELKAVKKDDPQSLLDEEFSSGKYKKYARFTMAVLGAIPWVGSVIGAAAGLSSELDQDKINDLFYLWLQEHREKINDLKLSLSGIYGRLDNFGDEIQERIESEEYLDLVRATFNKWDQVQTSQKKEMLKRLITNAGATDICEDDLVLLFLHWIEFYHETHFKVIKIIYSKQRITRKQIWDILDGSDVREDSTEASLFNYLMRDLSTGGLIRQEREVSQDGRFYKKTRERGSSSSPYMESAFEDTKFYELTELGKKFVHYVLDDVVLRLEDNNDEENSNN